MDEQTNLESPGDVIDALGGATVVARLVGLRPTAVSNWRRPGARLPPNSFVVLTDALSAIGRTAPASLWGMRERSNKAIRAA